jgi:hypothetical protein
MCTLFDPPPSNALLKNVAVKFVELRLAGESIAKKMCAVMDEFDKHAASAMYPDDMLEVLKIRLKNPNLETPSTLSSVGLSIEETLSRLSFLLTSAKIATEKEKSSMLNTQSSFFIAAMQIVKAKDDTLIKQIALELLSLHYERNFIWEMLKDLNANMSNAASGMIFGLFNKCLPNLIEAVKAILMMAEDARLIDLKVGNVLSGRVKLLMALYILGPETVASIVFSNLVRISGPGGAEEMDLINKISEAIFITLKYKKKIEQKLPKAVKPFDRLDVKRLYNYQLLIRWKSAKPC